MCVLTARLEQLRKRVWSRNLAQRDDDDIIKLRDAKRRRERDFIALFNALWYRDFPIICGHERKARRAMWTTHIASVVKSCADLIGFFTRFETGKRTDAVIQMPSDDNWAKVEWEWRQPLNKDVNEIQKLFDASELKEAHIFIFIGYSDEAKITENLKAIERQWRSEVRHLIVFLITFKNSKDGRKFKILQTYRVKFRRATKIREQYALPWDVRGSRWEAAAKTPTLSAPLPSTDTTPPAPPSARAHQG